MKKTVLFLLGCLFIVVLISVNVFAGTARYSFSVGPGTKKAYEVNPGDKISGSFLLTMIDDVEADFSLSFVSKSSNPLAQKGSGSVLDMSTWVNFLDGSGIHIDGTPPGRQEVLIPFEITIPGDLGPGDYRGAMKIYLVMPDANGGGGSGVRLTTAIAIPIRLSIPGDVFHALNFQSMDFVGFIFTEDNLNRRMIKLDFAYENSGNVLLRPTVNIAAADLFGNPVYSGEHVLGDVFPSTGAGTKVVLEELEPFIGWVDITSDLFYSIVNIDGRVDGSLFEAGSGTLRVYYIPWLQVWIILAVILLVLAIFVYRKYRVYSLKSISESYVVKKGESLQDVCSKFRVGSKYLIIVNGLKRPYFLKANDVLLIPLKKEK